MSTRRGIASSLSGPGAGTPGAGRRYGGWNDDDLDDEDAWAGGEESTELDGYQLDELVDWSITVDRWIDPSGVPAEPVATAVRDDEVCATTPSAQLRPYASEYEGYMGNYGNTMDRWYRRAALLVWPRQRAFAVRAEASPDWALVALSTSVRSGDMAGAREMAATLEPFWNTVARLDRPPSFFTKALHVAHGLDQPALAAMLLDPFRLELLACRHVPALVALVEGYGERWARDLLAVWSGPGPRWPPSTGQDRAAWVASLAGLSNALTTGGDTGATIARLLVQDSWKWLREAIEHRYDLMPPSRRDGALRALAKSIVAVLESTAVITATDLRDEAVGYLCGENDHVLACLMEVLRAARTLSPATYTVAGFDALAQHCVARLEVRLAHPARAADDWSIDVPDGCSCELCDVLGGFLTDPARRTFEWPLAEQRRRHVHSRLDRAELPVRHQTRRTGRPYTLVLTKTEAVFERERQARSRDEADLAWLNGDRSARVRARGRR